MSASVNGLAIRVPLFTLHWIAFSGFSAAAKSLSGKAPTPFRCDSPLERSARHSFAPLQKSRRSDRCCMGTLSPIRNGFRTGAKVRAKP